MPARAKPHPARILPHVVALDEAVASCQRCPRLSEWCARVARERRAAYAAEEYWGRAVPAFGPADASLLVVGLAPGAHGANRTGRMFTGDRSGDWLFRALHRAGLAMLPTSSSRDDGQQLIDTRITAVVHCAPPDNKPTVDERDECIPYLGRELELMGGTVRAALCLGTFALDGLLRACGSLGAEIPRPRPKFGHGVEIGPIVVPGVDSSLSIYCSYHPSQQNTFTGRLTEPMLDDVVGAAASAAGAGDRHRNSR